MKFTPTIVRRIFAAVALGSTAGTLVTIGSWSPAVYEADEGKIAAGLAVVALVATWMPRFFAPTPIGIMAALGVLGCDAVLWDRINTVNSATGGFAQATAGWGLALQTLAAICLLVQPIWQLVRDNRRAQAGAELSPTPHVHAQEEDAG